MYSLSKIALSADIASEIMAAQFGSANKLADFSELKEGLFNAAALLEMQDGTKYVLKAAPAPDIRVLRYEKDIMRAEVESIRLVRQRTNIPAPEIVCYDSSHRLLPGDYCIMRFLPGVLLHRFRHELPEAALVKIKRDLGAMAQQLSQITNDAFGYWSQPEAPGVSWRVCFDAMLRGVVQDGLDIGVELPIPYAELLALAASHYDALDEITTPRLVHWDLWDGNIFIDPVTHQISGVIDFERVLWGDPLIEAFFGDTNPQTPYAEGFGEGVFQTRNQVRRRLLYNAYLFAIMVIETFYRRFDNDWQINFARERILETVAALRA